MEISSLPQEFADRRTKELPAYGPQEPFRWIADVTVMEAFESGVLDLPDFYFTGDDYRYHFQPEAKHKFLDLLRGRFNSVVRYNGRALKWDTVIERKTIKLGRCLIGRIARLDLSEPSPNLRGTNELELRRRILSLTRRDAERLGIGKSTLHNLRCKAQSSKTFEVYAKVRKRLS